MRLLLDTHAVLWWLKGIPKLSKTAEQAIADRGNEILASVVSAYEIGLKVRAGKLDGEVEREFPLYLDRADIRILPLSLAHMSMGAGLNWAHRDRWDRLILAQSLLEDCKLVTVDRSFVGSPAEVLW